MRDVFDWILSTQRTLQGQLAQRTTHLFDSPLDLTEGVCVALLLGLVHAMTPGHGKSVMFSYFSGHDARPLAGLAVAGGAAATHGLLAVLLVLTLGRVLGPLGRPTGATAWLELVSALIVTGIGVYYIASFLRRAGHGGTGTGHVTSTRSALAMAMGMLPCPLTIIVVGAAIASGALGAGLTLAAAISIGAAVTIGSVGLAAMALRRLGLALGSGTRLIGVFMTGLELASSLLILGLGGLALAGAMRRIGW
jgi:ABC-type nickel/cobalt efflux system permease component RcnA